MTAAALCILCSHLFCKTVIFYVLITVDGFALIIYNIILNKYF